MSMRTSLPLRTATNELTGMPASARLATVRRVVREAVPGLADFALCYLSSASTIHCVAAAHATAGGTRLLRALMRAYRVRRGDRDSTVAQVIRSARPIVRTDIALDMATPRAPANARETVAALHQRLATRSALAVPVIGDGAVLGALTLCYSDSARSFSARDVPIAMRLAARIGHALTDRSSDATVRLRSATGDARQGTTLRRRVAARNQI